MINLRNGVNKEKIPENENPDKVMDIVQEILNFNKQQEGSRIKILTLKQMLQKLPIALAQVQACNTSENHILSNQIIYSLYQTKEITKKYITI